MDLIDAICGRRAVRQYKLERPSEYVLRQLIEAATWAPSAMNGQAWHFTIITRQELLDQIAVRARLWLKENEQWLAANQEVRALLADPDFHMLHHAPVLIVISAPAAGKWGAEGCAVAAQNLMLAATGHGLGSCWIGLAQDWLNTPEGRQAIALPGDERVVAPLVVGYANEKPQALSRHRPNITWIRDEAMIVEDGEPSEPMPIRGLFDGLLTRPDLAKNWRQGQ
jgi:nitroreductase